MKKHLSGLLAGLLVSIVLPAQAVDVDVSGYASFKAVSGNNDDNVSYYGGLVNTDHVDFDTRDNHLGLQFSAAISPRMDMTVVMSAEGGPNAQYNIATEWAYANYKFNPDWSLRMGKVKGPFYMVSDYRDVGYAYPWVRPPAEVYSTNPIKALSGVDLIFQKNVRDIGYLLELYAGTGHNKGLVQANAVDAGVYVALGRPDIVAGNEIGFKTYDMKGFNASISYEGITFRAGYFDTKVEFGPFTDLEGSFAGIGLIVDWRNVVVYSEYIRRDTVDLLQAAFPDQDAYYLTLGYRVGKYLPYATYAKLDKGKDNSPFALMQDSMALGLRYEVDDAAALKFEAMQVNPDSEAGDIGRYGLFDAPLSGTNKGMVYTIALDVIF